MLKLCLENVEFKLRMVLFCRLYVNAYAAGPGKCRVFIFAYNVNKM